VIVESWDGYKWCVEDDSHKLVLGDGERAVIEFIKMVSDKSKVLVDVGAYLGSHTIRLAKYFGVVIAFEPNPEAVRIFKKNLELNGIKNVMLLECALGDQEGELDLYLRGGSSTLLKGYEGKGKVKVKVRRLDDILYNVLYHNDVIKIDVEGYEEKVIRGALKTIKKHKPIIVIEHHEYREYKELEGSRERITKLLDGYIPINLNGVHYAYIPEDYDLEKVKDALVWHYISLIVRNLEEGRPWYYGLPYTWWYGAGVTDFLLALPDHILKEPRWVEKIIKGEE